MKSILPSAQRRAAGMTSAVLVALVFVAACGEDRAVGPREVTTPTSVSAVRSAIPTITTEYVDYAGNLVGGGALQLKDTLGTTVLTIVDDAANDADKTPGKFKFAAAPGVYQLCETMPPPGYTFPANQKTLCTLFHTAPANGSLHVGPFTVLLPFSAAWATVRGFFPANTPLYVGPTAFQVTKPDGTFIMNVIDQGFKDIHGTLGITHVKLPAAGDYVVCQLWEIQGYWLPKPQCHAFTATFGTVAWADYFINYEKQVLNP
jgi:hypothetical protein